MKKYSVFHIEGGLGKHIAATAVAKSIKDAYPDRQLLIVCAWPDIFLNLPFVDRVYRTGNTPYFYQDYIKDKDTLLFKHEPYFTSDHIHGNTSLIQNWCNLYKIPCTQSTPVLSFNLREKQLIGNQWNFQRPVLLLHTSGGPLKQDNAPGYRWTRDMPISVIDQLIQEFHQQYEVVVVTREQGYIPEGVTAITKQFRPMELLTILPRTTKRVLIDSCLQHAAAALNLSSTVLWIGTYPTVFGYDMHDNITATQKPEFNLPDSYLFSYSFEGVNHECPYQDDSEIFNIDQIIESVKRQNI